MNHELRIATVDGQKMLIINGRTLLTKEQARSQIALLDERVTKQLPAARQKLDGQRLLAQAQANIDRQIAQAAAVKEALETAVNALE